MKKTLLASAIAAATFSGAAMAQSTMTPEDMAKALNAMPTFYGNIQYAYSYEDSDQAGYTSDHFDNGTTIGLTHDHAITSDVEGFMKIELEGIGADNKATSNGVGSLDEAYIGVRGDSFGQVWIGSDDSPYEALIGDYGNWVYEVASLNPYSSATTGEGDMVQYMSPSFGGLTLQAAVQVNGEGQGGNEASQPYQLAATYSMGGLTATLAMDSNDGDTPYNSATGTDVSNENSYGVAFEYALDALVLDLYYDYRAAAEGVTVDNGDNAFDGAEGRSQIGVMGTYNLGANTFRLSYEMAETDADGLEVDVIMLQALHNVSDHIYVYTEAGRKNIEVRSGAEEEINQINLGAVYYF